MKQKGSTSMADETLLTVEEAAEYLKVSPAWVRDHAAGGRRTPQIPCIRLGESQKSPIRFAKSALLAFLKQRTTRAK